MSYTIVARSRALTAVVVSAAVVAALAVALPITSAQAVTPTQTFAPAQLINESALEAPAQVQGSYYPGGMFSATASERVAVNALEAQAVANTLADHGLPAGDGPAVLSWARSDADGNLWALILQAVNDVHAGTATSTEQSVNQWLVDSLKRQSILSTQDTGLEYTKWAGLGTAAYNSLITNNASLTQLTNFLATTPEPYTGSGSDTNPAGSTDGGYCVYQSPAPDQGDYTSNIFGTDAPQTCFTPCTSNQDCGPPVPDASTFATWGSADYENATVSSFGSTNGLLSTAQAASLLATVDIVASGFVGAGTSALLSGSGVAASFLQAVRPYTAEVLAKAQGAKFRVTPEEDESESESEGDDATDAVEDGLDAADEIGIDASATGIGIVLTAIIFVITTAIQEGLKIVGAADVPGEIAGMIDSARTSTPDPYAAEQGSPGTMFALFMNATIPQPSHVSCDNDFIVSSQAALGTPCLNPTAIPAPTSYDPAFTITPTGGSATTSGTLTLMDASSGWTPSYRLHGNWVVSTATVSGTTASVQGLTMHYSDWSGAPHTAWVYADHTPTSFVTVADNALGPDFDPNTCQQQGTCAVTSSIQVVSADGTDETIGLTPGAAAPTLPAGPCVAGPGCDATTTTTSVTGPNFVTVGQSGTYTAAVNADQGVNGTADFVAGAGASGCTGTALVPPSGGGEVIGKVATCSITFSKVGIYFVFATYSGSNTYQPSQGEITVTVGASGSRASTNTSVSAATDPVVYGQPDTYTATVDTGSSGLVPGGTVAFTASTGKTLCTAAVLSQTAPYTAVCPYAVSSDDSLTLVNPVTVTATYSGDPGTMSSVGTTAVTISPASTTTTVTASNDHPEVGQQVTYTATITVDAPGVATLEGGVTFAGGASCTTLGFVQAVPPVTVTCNATYSSNGPQEVDVTYDGDRATTESDGSTTVLVGPAPTTTTGTPAGPAAVGGTITDTAVVSSDYGPGTGTVSFTVCGPFEFIIGCPPGGTPDGAPVTLDSSGSATSPAFTTVHAGVYCFRATFNGDTDFTGSTDGSTTQCIDVQLIGQTVTFTSSPPSNPTVGGQYVGLAATGGATGNPITFGSQTPNFCTVTGTTVSFDHPGGCTVRAQQAGNEDYNVGLADQSFTISPVSSQVSVTGPATIAPRVVGQSATVTATVTVAQGIAAGTVQFAVNGVNSGAPVDVGTNGTAVSPPLLGAAGMNTVTATFTPSEDTFAGSSGTSSYLLDTAATLTTLTVRAKNLIAHVKAVFPGGGAPTGIVFFLVDGVQVGNAALVNGVATLAYTTAPGQTTQVAAQYPGDVGHNASSTSAAATNPTITASLTSAHAKTAYGWYNSAVVVTFTCTANGAPLTAACPDPITLKFGGADQIVTRTIYATNGGAASATVDVNIDQTPPTVELLGVPHPFFVGSAPPGQCVGADDLSGLASCTITVKSHPNGAYTYTALARDKAGNAEEFQISTAPAP